MHKSKKKVLVEKLKKKDEEAPQLIETYLFSNAIIKLVIIYIVLIIAFLLVDDVSKLSFISPKIFFTSMLIFIAIMILFIIYLSYYKYYKKEDLKEKIVVRLFDIYDLFSFILMTINICFFILLFILTPTIIDGNSMNNSYYDNDRVLVWHLVYTPVKDDAVIIDVSKEKYPALTSVDERFFIKRVIATEGDNVTFKKNAINESIGRLYVNGIDQKQYLTEETFKIMTTYDKNKLDILDENNIIKEGYSIVLGDNRSNSYDSRAIGAIKNEDIQGKVVFVFFSQNGNFGFPKYEVLN